MTRKPASASLLSALILLAAAGCEVEPPETARPLHGAGTTMASHVSDGYVAETDEWRRNRFERLTDETGWVTLTGLHWLKQGANSVGSRDGSDVELPDKAPARVGVVRLAGDRATFEPAASGLLIDGQPASGPVELRPDNEGEPTTVRIGSIEFFLIGRGDRWGIRARDREHPRRTELTRLDYYPIDPKWAVKARFEPYDPPREIPVLNIIGIVEPSRVPGALVFEIDGRTYRLDPIHEEGDERIFIIFGDETNGKTTYGAGRYVYADFPGPDGTTIIDFNRSYSPPCAFTEFATCPLPPRQNKLPVSITAGEKFEEHS